MENRPEFFEVCWAAQRSGLYYTCINWHFNADETAYILDDCDAQVLVISDTFRDLAAELLDKMPNVKLRLMVGATVSTATTRTRRRATASRRAARGRARRHADAVLVGHDRTSQGRALQDPRQRIGDLPAEMGMMTAVWGMDENAVYLSPAPMYHSAPLFYCMSTMRLGGTVIVMEQFDPEDGARVHREVPRHAQPVGADDVRADAEASRRRSARATTSRRTGSRSTRPRRARSRSSAR